MLHNIILIGLGGAIGAVSRYGMFIFIQRYYLSYFPIGTLCINALGCLMIGVLQGFFIKNNLTTHLSFFLITGFCGGFTTFSAFALDNYHLIQTQQFVPLMMNILLSVGICILFVGLGMYITSRV